MRQILAYAAMLLRAYARDVPALFFSLIVPLLIMVIFGLLNLGAFGHVNLAVVDEARNADSARFVETLSAVPTLRVERADRDEAIRRVARSEIDMAVVVPSDFRVAPAARGARVPTVTVYENVERPQQVSVGKAILAQIVDGISFAVAGTGPIVELREEPVSAHRLRYVDFLVPGILGMNVMQLAVFSVAFGLVADRKNGVLRRIMATPMPPHRFLAAHVLMRLVLAVLQVLVLVGVARLAFGVQFVGSLVDVLALTTLGAVLFLTVGFAVAGWARTENQVPPVANLITLPQFFLSGVFFPRDAVPEAIRGVTGLLPLTFLNDAVREVSTQGATLWDVRGDVAGLVVWSIVGFLLAARLFRFEVS